MFIATREKLEKEEGFTLIELLVVVIIIGILAAIAIPTFLNQRRRGWQAELTSNVRNTALEIEAQITAASGTIPAPGASNALPTTVTGVGPAATNYFYAVDTTAGTWCVAGTSTRAGMAGSIAYESASGGMQPYAEAGTLTCTP